MAVMVGVGGAGGLFCFLFSFDTPAALEWRSITGKGVEPREFEGLGGGCCWVSPQLPSERHMGSSLVLLGPRGSSQNSHDNEARGHSERWPKAGPKSF